MAVTFPAGVYYIGDLCYVINEKDWEELLEQSGHLGLDFDSDQWFGKFKKFGLFVGSTAHGDGMYYDNRGGTYAVDSGTIGIIDATWPDVNESEIEMLGCIVHFHQDFKVQMPERGLFHFDGLTIDTREEDEEWP